MKPFYPNNKTIWWDAETPILLIRNSHKMHICQQSIMKGLPEWMMKPLCANGGIQFRHWEFYKALPSEVTGNDICGVCCRVLQSKNYAVIWADTIVEYEVDRYRISQPERQSILNRVDELSFTPYPCPCGCDATAPQPSEHPALSALDSVADDACGDLR